ncbi:DUF6236 family protein [Pararhizobium sp. BT-229]|uniref:DUF6236 family protein n=1 Tax=Pararhizobium sp. BT-229 TaxID=2986923 RepID=UPI0021F7F8AA|nr:DUF6236 family protein [Pararhizobium sp. BT-229]MCV9965425.1 DUF6236 family protein [Pararhizobium sp. BT-229]
MNIKSLLLDPQDLRTSLLFWDKLDYPSQNVATIGLQPEAKYLSDVGILQRTLVTLPLMNPGDAIRIAHTTAFRQLEEKEPGKWSVASSANSVTFADDELIAKRGLLVRLFGAIPVPDKDVPLNEILEFKEKRHAELVSLRHHLEAIYSRIASADDKPLAECSEFEALDVAIRDHTRVSIEGGLKQKLSDISANLSVSNAAVASIAAVAGYSQGLPIVNALLAGLAASISVDVGVSLKGAKDTSNPFRYITSYHKWLF